MLLPRHVKPARTFCVTAQHNTLRGKVLSTLFHIHELTDNYNWVSVALIDKGETNYAFLDFWLLIAETLRDSNSQFD